jgi:hypothetical protein
MTAARKQPRRSIMTLSIMTLSIMTLSIMTLSIMTLSMMTFSIRIIRKDCFQVKSNLLTDFRFTTHMNIMILN